MEKDLRLLELGVYFIGMKVMEIFNLERPELVVSASGERFVIGKRLGMGTFGTIHAVGDDKIAKIIRTEDADTEAEIIQEITIQQKLSEKEPDVCPKIHAFGKIKQTGKYIAVMEKCTGTARDVLKSGASEEDFLDYFDQIAKIFARLEKYQFNHRDLKSDNVMYKLDPVTGKKKFLLIDFGFACATFDGVKYAGTLYFESHEKCFRRSRDLAQMVFETLVFSKSADLTNFMQLVLTFKWKGKDCDMTRGCFPDFDGSWLNTYDFLNNDAVDNPNTTPEGLQKAITSYRLGGIKACKKGFIVNPIDEACVPKPDPPAPAALKVAVSPKPHVASPVVVSKKTIRTPPKDCPPGKVRNSVTKRCIKKKEPKECPPGKVRNPDTGRCKTVK